MDNVTTSQIIGYEWAIYALGYPGESSSYVCTQLVTGEWMIYCKRLQVIHESDNPSWAECKLEPVLRSEIERLEC